MAMSVFDRIRELLDTNGVRYDCKEHPPVFTSPEAAAVRGCELRQGAKSLVLHVDKQRYVLAVIAADRQTDFAALRRRLGAKKVRLASPEEVRKQTGCTVGSVPPFGNIVGLPMYVDPSLGENEVIAFNPGSHTHSILMRYEDYARLVQAEIVSFARGAAQ